MLINQGWGTSEAFPIALSVVSPPAVILATFEPRFSVFDDSLTIICHSTAHFAGEMELLRVVEKDHHLKGSAGLPSIRVAVRRDACLTNYSGHLDRVERVAAQCCHDV